VASLIDAVASSLGSTRITEAVTLANADVYAKNTPADQDRVKPAVNASAALVGGVLTIELPPVPAARMPRWKEHRRR
jgi:hypothetical protein